MKGKRLVSGTVCFAALFLFFVLYENGLGAIPFLLLSIFFFVLSYRTWKKGRGKGKGNPGQAS
ncbi:hypothetical protein D0466_14330 [Peribacillus glennii]|uniref:Uncharacterized protein n=1 Tax=Peribacillus glennii TaxID=2303991 RepID=A0A372LBQ1_9BACI|nr:hypothetical protein D0466_14330 [Peribacillus glennii]